MKRAIFATLALLGSLGATYAQSDNFSSVRSVAQGVLMNRDIMNVSEMRNFSQSTFQYGTARSMAMAGAMTSLGADASSMMINPAGLGMYRTGEISFTPMVVVQNSNTKGGKSYLNDGASNVQISNFSAIFNLYESGRSRLISLNAGVGYNKISDLNYEYSFRSMNQSSSIANLFSEQFTSAGIELDDIQGIDDWGYYMPTNLWGASLGYKTGLTDMTDDSSGSPIWTSSWISPDASVDQYMAVDSYGSVGEYDISLGANIDNVLYLGFTFGIQSVYQELNLIYGEEYNNNQMEGNYLDYVNYNQASITNGAGYNLKFGATYRPTKEFRLGVAYHSPTWYNVKREYQAAMGSWSIYENESVFVADETPILLDSEEDRWRFNSPQRILIGGSYMVDNRAIISVDYQRDWYGSVTTRDVPYGVSEQTYTGMSEAYNSVNTLRIGLEYKLQPQFALRGGYGVTSSLLNDNYIASKSDLWSIPVTNKINYFALGLGYAPTRGVSFDLTYMHQNTEYSDSTLFYGTSSSAQSDSFLTTIRQNNIALSMVLKM